MTQASATPTSAPSESAPQQTVRVISQATIDGAAELINAAATKNMFPTVPLTPTGGFWRRNASYLLGGVGTVLGLALGYGGKTYMDKRAQARNTSGS